MKSRPFVYVTGCPRSGTYLLSMRIGQALSIAFPIETHFAPFFLPFLPLWGNLQARNNRAELLEDIYRFLEIWLKEGHKDMPYNKALPFTLCATRPAAESIIAGTSDYPGLIEQLFRQYAAQHSMDMWGDKSVHYYPVPLSTMQKITPDMKVIHILRDGRDVALSWCRTWFGPASIAEAALGSETQFVIKHLRVVAGNRVFTRATWKELLHRACNTSKIVVFAIGH